MSEQTERLLKHKSYTVEETLRHELALAASRIADALEGKGNNTDCPTCHKPLKLWCATCDRGKDGAELDHYKALAEKARNEERHWRKQEEYWRERAKGAARLLWDAEAERDFWRDQAEEEGKRAEKLQAELKEHEQKNWRGRAIKAESRLNYLEREANDLVKDRDAYKVQAEKAQTSTENAEAERDEAVKRAENDEAAEYWRKRALEAEADAANVDNRVLLAKNEERRACAEVRSSLPKHIASAYTPEEVWDMAQRSMADAIRARGDGKNG